MKAIFYDRRNKREVSNEQLMEINLVTHYLCADPQEPLYETYTITELTGTLGYKSYKSNKCNKDQHWDLHLNIEDLVFLRLEE